jgi:hypothetical protein
MWQAFENVSIDWQVHIFRGMYDNMSIIGVVLLEEVE